MARLVLDMPQMFATPPPLLTPMEVGDQVEANAADDARRKTRVVTQSHRFTKLQVLTLVCGCFFGMFPDQDIVKQAQFELSPQTRKAGRRGSSNDDIIQFPYFTAVRMFSAPGHMGKMVVLKGHKLRCILQYFLRVVPRVASDREALSTEVIDFTRVGVHLPGADGRILSEQTPQELLAMIGTASDFPQTVNQVDDDGVDTPRMHSAKCVSDILIEDLDKHLQIDFANKFAGGGVLNSGCVQEEIRFLLSPELLVSCLIFAKLESHEAFVIHGTERYSAYQGYGGSFVYGGNFQDSTSLISQPDGCFRRQCVIVGIDATDYGSAQVERQYTRGHVWRDLVKAYAGFAYPNAYDDGRCWPVATGNWGCGVFQGDRELKFLIQWLAASLRHRDLVYVLFERDLDLQTKVNPLLELAASPKAHEWDRQSAGLTQWLVGFLFDELSNGRGTRGEQGVLTRAVVSLKRALATFQHSDVETKQPENSPQVHTSPLSSESKQSISSTPFRRENQTDDMAEASKKKPKTMKKELHQTSCTFSEAALDVSMATFVALATTAMGSRMASAGEKLTTATTSSEARVIRRAMALANFVSYGNEMTGMPAAPALILL
ncbi:unnamed protein product [Phytophthora fragariaefolia]|uniref:poly(ADP-ribose) glycohydrolase n=1 Tax=Phytophthora fragariaefolia TaxID=1490495 RepID=A0A9W6Y7E9_9STRA|nr:unnamed protein product [Phytophthora fragariaefolia]